MGSVAAGLAWNGMLPGETSACVRTCTRLLLELMPTRYVGVLGWIDYEKEAGQEGQGLFYYSFCPRISPSANPLLGSQLFYIAAGASISYFVEGKARVQGGAESWPQGVS